MSMGLHESKSGHFMPNRHLRQCFFICWSNKNLFSNQNIKNPCLLSSQVSYNSLHLPLHHSHWQDLSHTNVSSNYPQNNSGTFHNAHRGLFVSDEIQSLFCGSIAHLLVTYSNQTSASLEVIKRCITQNVLLQSWRRSSWPCDMLYSLSCIKMKGRAAALFRLMLQKVQW